MSNLMMSWMVLLRNHGGDEEQATCQIRQCPGWCCFAIMVEMKSKRSVKPDSARDGASLRS